MFWGKLPEKQPPLKFLKFLCFWKIFKNFFWLHETSNTANLDKSFRIYSSNKMEKTETWRKRNIIKIISRKSFMFSISRFPQQDKTVVKNKNSTVVDSDQKLQNVNGKSTREFHYFSFLFFVENFILRELVLAFFILGKILLSALWEFKFDNLDFSLLSICWCFYD